MSDRDVSTWFEALAGRTDAAAAAADHAEARALRAWIREQVLAEEIPIAAIDPQREARLLERARAEGLLPPLPTPAARPGGWLRSLYSVPGAMALATASAVLMFVFLPRPAVEPVETLRGADHGAVRIETAEPQALQRRILDELRGAGVQTSGFERLGRYGIDAELPHPLPSQVRQVLDRHHIPPPADHVLVLEIAAP